MTWENSRQSQVLLKGYRIGLLCQPCPNIWFDTLTTGFCEAGNIALLVQCDFVSKYCSGISLPKVLIALKSQFGLSSKHLFRDSEYYKIVVVGGDG